jgi:hypothetical protein
LLARARTSLKSRTTSEGNSCIEICVTALTFKNAGGGGGVRHHHHHNQNQKKKPGQMSLCTVIQPNIAATSISINVMSVDALRTVGVLHHPSTHKGEKLWYCDLSCKYTDSVATLKHAMSQRSKLPENQLTLIYNGAIRNDSQSLADSPLKSNAPGNTCCIHFRVSDPAIEAAVTDLLAKGGIQFVDLCDVVLEGKP